MSVREGVAGGRSPLWKGRDEAEAVREVMVAVFQGESARHNGFSREGAECLPGSESFGLEGGVDEDGNGNCDEVLPLVRAIIDQDRATPMVTGAVKRGDMEDKDVT